LAADAEAVVARVVKKAKAGDAVCLKLVLERLVPVRSARDRTVDVALPAIGKARDLVEAAAAVIDGVASGQMTISEGREFMSLLEGERKLIETTDLLVRIEALEGVQSPVVELDGARFEEGLARELAARVRTLDRSKEVA
jgi:hypothetical protein